jgi:hypothetical protein
MGLDPSDGFEEQSEPAETDQQEQEIPAPLFPHPSWAVGVVMVFAMLTIFAGLSNPIWFLIGSPFLLVMAIFIWVRFKL